MQLGAAKVLFPHGMFQQAPRARCIGRANPHLPLLLQRLLGALRPTRTGGSGAAHGGKVAMIGATASAPVQTGAVGKIGTGGNAVIVGDMPSGDARREKAMPSPTAGFATCE